MLSVDVCLRSPAQKPQTRCEITNGDTMTQVSAFSFDLVKTVRITEAHEKVQSLSDSIRQFLLHKRTQIYQKLHVSTSITSLLGQNIKRIEKGTITYIWNKMWPLLGLFVCKKVRLLGLSIPRVRM
jgi:hypothetical protein